MKKAIATILDGFIALFAPSVIGPSYYVGIYLVSNCMFASMKITFYSLAYLLTLATYGFLYISPFVLAIE